MDGDGRRARGAASSAALVAATLRLLERDGVAGISSRAVAREAGVAANAVAYHFGSVDNLLVQSIRSATATLAEATAGLRPGHFAEDLSDLLVESAAGNRSRLVAEFELYLLAGRRPALQGAARAWSEALLVPLGDLDRDESTKLIAIIDGLCVNLLVTDDYVDRAGMRRIIEEALPARHRSGG